MYKGELYGLNYSVPKGTLIDFYRKDMINILVRLLPKLELSEIEEAVNYTIYQTYNAGLDKGTSSVSIYNNRSNTISTTNLLTLSNSILDKKPIMTTQGVLFMRHGTQQNPFYNFVQYLLDKRDEAKNEMKKYPKGSEEYNKWNLKQLNYCMVVQASLLQCFIIFMYVLQSLVKDVDVYQHRLLCLKGFLLII